MGNRVGTVDQTGLAPDILPVIVLVLMPRGASFREDHLWLCRPGLNYNSQGPQHSLSVAFCVRLAQCLLGNVVEVVSA